MAYKVYTHVNTNQLTTGTTTVLIGPVDVRGFETFCVEIQNCHSGVALIGLRLQQAFTTDSTLSGFSEARNWQDIPSNTVPQFPVTTLSASDSVKTSAIRTMMPWIRLIGGASATSVGQIRMFVGGMLS